MIHSCCDGSIIDVPPKLYVMIADTELERLCIEGYRCQMGNPWFSSFLETNGRVLTKEEIEEEEEQEYENEDSDIPDLNIDESYWES